MKKTTKLSVLTLILAALLGVGTVSGVSTLVNAEEPSGLSAPLAEKVKIGETVEVPEYYHEVNGASQKATANILLPDGTTYVGTSFTAVESGRYVIEYTIGGEVVHTESCLAVMGALDLFSTNVYASMDGLASYKYTPTELDQDAFKGVARPFVP